MNILITGAAGFIGANLVHRLIAADCKCNIVGLDNMNDYYDVSLKAHRLQQIEKLVGETNKTKWTFVKGSIADKQIVNSLFEQYKFSIVVNLAAQAGVRYSITNEQNNNIL